MMWRSFDTIFRRTDSLCFSLGQGVDSLSISIRKPLASSGVSLGPFVLLAATLDWFWARLFYLFRRRLHHRLNDLLRPLQLCFQIADDNGSMTGRPT